MGSCDSDTVIGGAVIFSIIFAVPGIVLLSLYTFPNPPKLSLEEFSVPAFTNPSDESSGNIYFDLKLRNMNKAIGLYYDEPFSIAFFYYPYDEPYQKYVWSGTVPAFYQGNGKTKHIRSFMGNNLQLPSTVVVDPEKEPQDLVEAYHVRTPLKDNLQLPSRLVGDTVGRTLTVSFQIAVVVNYRFKYWAGSSKHQVQLGGNVLVDLSSGETVSAESIDLVESAATAGGPVRLKFFIITFVLIMCS